MERKFAAENAGQDERIQRQHAHFTDVNANLESKLDEKDSAQDARMDELRSVIQDHHAHFTAS